MHQRWGRVGHVLMVCGGCRQDAYVLKGRLTPHFDTTGSWCVWSTVTFVSSLMGIHPRPEVRER
jgi:hypothetical protein